MRATPSAPSLQSRVFSVAMGSLVFAATLVCYWPALNGTPVWDDAAHLTKAELQPWHGLLRIWTELGATQQYYPVLHSAFWFEHRLWGDHVIGYHLFNIALHAGSACLFALLLRRLWTAAHGSRTIPGGLEWVAALVFAVHPVAVESVAWISEQKNTLSLFLGLSASLLFLRFDAGRQRRHYVAASLLFLLALGCKTVTAVLPAALLVILWWRHGRIKRRDVLPLLPWFAIGIVAGAATAWIERRLIGATGTEFSLTALQRLLLASHNVWFYLQKLVWPADLMFIYPRWDVAREGLRWIAGLAVLAVITFVLWRLRTRARGPLAGWLLYLGLLFPALGFFNVYPFLFSYVADHFQYHASLAVIGLLVGTVGGAVAHAPRSLSRVVGSAALAAIVALGVTAHHESGGYRDSGTLYRRTLAANPACWMAHNNLGEELSHSAATLDEAIAHYRAALRLQPDNPDAHNNLGSALLATRPDEAILHFRAALKRAPEFGEARLNLANALAATPDGRPEALREYAETVRRYPNFAEAHFCFGNTLAALPDRRADAIQELERAIALRPDYIEAHVNLATLLAQDPGQRALALEHARTAVRLDPGRARSHYDLGVLLDSVPGHEEDAAAEFRETIRLDPTHAGAHNNLGLIYARQRRYAEARTEWERALAIDPTLAAARGNLELLERYQPR